MKQIILPLALAAACTLALSKLPAPVLDDAAKAKAAEATAKTAWQGKLDAFQLCRSQDRVAAHYRKTAGALAANAAAAPVAPSAAPTAPSAAPATPPVATASATKPATSAAAGTATVVAGPPTPTPCADPGPFAYTPPEQKPIEASGAHSPAGNATSPPSTTTPAAATPAKKS